MDSHEGSIVALGWRTGRVQPDFEVNCSTPGRHGGQRKVVKLQPFRSVFDPIRGQCCFLFYTQMGKVQEVTDQRILPTLRRLNWNHSCSRYAVSKDSADLSFHKNHPLTRGWYLLQWTQKIAEIVKNSLGFVATQECPLAVVLFLEILHLFQPPDLS